MILWYITIYVTYIDTKVRKDATVDNTNTLVGILTIWNQIFAKKICMTLDYTATTVEAILVLHANTSKEQVLNESHFKLQETET